MKKLLLFVIIIFSISCNAQTIVKFQLEKTMVDTVTYVYSEENSYSIIIKLNEIFTNKFKNLTEDNIGNYLQIIFEDEVIIGANIDSKIPNGLILISRLDEKRFNKIWNKLRE